MRKRLFVPGLTLVLSIAGPGWAIQPAAVANAMTVAPEATGGSTVTGRATSEGASGLLVIVEASSGLAELNAINVDATSAGVVGADGARPLNAAPSRRLLGVGLLTISGIVVVLRVRRRHTFLTSRPLVRKHVGAPANV